MLIKAAVAHLADGRSDFFAKRKPLAEEELRSLDWLRQRFDLIESEILCSGQDVADFARQVASSNAQSLIIHVPIWADPIFSIKLSNHLSLPILLLGNDRPDTSSMVGLLGAGGALDQVGVSHQRVFEHASEGSRRKVAAFIRASAARHNLRGQTLGQFGGRSLGIFTAGADPAQWQQLFGVDIEILDQYEIIKTAENLPDDEVQKEVQWLSSRLGGVRFGGTFNAQTYERQVRSYMATRALVEKHGFDFVSVKCQPEMSDGYVTQCVAHMLMNSGQDARGEKQTMVHACEADADGALTMQILHLLSGGRPAALMDLRWFDAAKGNWTLANCGAIAAAFFATPQDPSGFSGMQAQEHVFGRGGGGALSGMMSPQVVTLARLCRRAGKYWMAIVPGEAETRNPEELKKTTAAFPQAFLRSKAGLDFADAFCSNHIHLVSGDFTEELVTFCQLVGIPWQIWK